MQIQNNNILLDKAISIIDNGRKKVIEAIYNESTKSYYRLGKLIITDEQKGEIKAEYGKKNLENLLKKFILKDCRKFYRKSQSITDQFKNNLLINMDIKC